VFKKLLVANRGEIAIRVLRAANELGIRTVAVYSKEDRLSLHRFKADESYLIGEGLGPVNAYLSMESILEIARETNVEAIHPGYGFLSESPEFAEACSTAGRVFVGPSPDILRELGDKVAARQVAQKAGVPVLPATARLPEDQEEIKRLSREVGYPVMLKASWGGGGRGMRVIENEKQLAEQVEIGRKEALTAFGKDDVFLEKFIERARHVEVQILGDNHGHIVHLFERDCSVQRRNQKVVERAPAHYLSEDARASLCAAAIKLGREVGYNNAGTVEFLLDADSDAFYFIEVNPRIQVEHTVTEEVTGLDIVKAQIRIAAGKEIGIPGSFIPPQEEIRLNGFALQCRVTTEDPGNNFIPDFGRITAYRGATGFGIRLDGGTAYSGAVVTRHYDSLLEKVTAWAPTANEAIRRMDRALREFRIRGVATNLAFLENLINHPSFQDGSYTTRFIDETPELFEMPVKRDRAMRLLSYIAHVTVNGNPEVKGRPRPTSVLVPVAPEAYGEVPKGTKDLLDDLGAEGFARWMKEQTQVLVTDTTMRDAHQSLIATRMRSADMAQVAPAYARLLPKLLSLECWGGATFDVAMRFLKECPWERLRMLRRRAPNIILQMLLRASNGVGYTNYPDNVVRYFVQQAAENGVDLFRVFDSLNWVENMRVAMDTVIEAGALCEGAICYTGDILDPGRSKYDLRYYVGVAKDLEAAGAHILGLKDMAGLLKPASATVLIKALKGEVDLPIHLHTHDTSGISAATVLAAVDAGVDAIDAAMDSWSGLTSQPNLGSIVEALRFTERSTGLDPVVIRRFSDYWERVRAQYRAFETDIRAGTSEVYLHEMPGGQFTNLKVQARSIGLDERWQEVAEAYVSVNMLFGDVIKVTPSSKVVGDMALMMVSQDLTPEDVADPKKEIAFPASVVSFFKGEIGQPHGGFPKALQAKVLKGDEPLKGRPGDSMAPVDLDARRIELQRTVGREISKTELASSLMYEEVFEAYLGERKAYGPLHQLPTSTFFYGMTPDEEITVDIEQGKTLVIRCSAIGEARVDGTVEVFFELNGQPRMIRVKHLASATVEEPRVKADPANPEHVGAPLPGLISTLSVSQGVKVQVGDRLLTIEAMKMETAVTAERDGTVAELHVKSGETVDAKDLLLVLKE